MQASELPAQVSFDAMYREHARFVWRALRRLGVDAAGIEDAVQDVFVVVHRRLQEFDARGSARAWLGGIAVRVAHDHRRRVARKEGKLTPLERATEPGSAAPGPLEHAIAAQAAAMLDRALDALPEEQRAVFVLSEIEQLTMREIGVALGVKLNTVNSRLRAARQKINELVTRMTGNRGGSTEGGAA